MMILCAGLDAILAHDVIPATAGSQFRAAEAVRHQIPAFAGMTPWI